MTGPDNPFVTIDIIKALRGPAPALDYILPGLLAGKCGMIVSHAGADRTRFMLATAFEVALDQVGDIWGADPKPRRVAYVSAHEPAASVSACVGELASMLVNDYEQELVAANVAIESWYGCGLAIASMTPSGIVPTDHWNGFVDRLTGAPVDLLVLDGFTHLVEGIDTTLAGHVRSLILMVEQSCRKAGCAVILADHSPVADPNINLWEVNLSPMSESEANAHGVPTQERGAWMRFSVDGGYRWSMESLMEGENWVRRHENGVLRAENPPTKV